MNESKLSLAFSINAHPTTTPTGWVYSEECLELKQFLKPKELSHSFMSLHASFGVDVQKRYNIEIIDYGVVLFATGNTVQILDLFMHKKKILMAPGDCSFNAVGAIAVHPSKEFFAVAEIGLDPKIYVYTYPGLRTVRILRKGTERGYSDIEFSHTGEWTRMEGSDERRGEKRRAGVIVMSLPCSVSWPALFISYRAVSSCPL